MKLMQRLSAVSAFARPEEHLARKTLHGAIVTLIGVLLASTLFIHEVLWFLQAKGVAKMEVDLQRRHDLNIHVDMTFHAVPCAALSVDIIDAAGTSESDVSLAGGSPRLHKIRLDARGRRIARGDEGEYHTPQSQRLLEESGGAVMALDLGAALQQMGDMEEEMGAHEGCRLRGDATVRRVAGKLHFALHQSGMMDMLPQMLTGHVLPRMRNVSHTVHRLTFGPSFPGQVNPLDGTSRIEQESSGLHAYKYYIKIVPTTYTTRLGVLLETSQYSVSEYAMPLLVPGDSTHGALRREPFVDMVYDLSPIVMRIHESPLGLLHFVVRLCAVVGGALSVTRLLDRVVDAAVRAARPPRGRASSAGGGGGGGSGGGGAPLMGSGGLLPTRSGSVSARSSLHGNGSMGGMGPGASMLRHSSGGGMPGFGLPGGLHPSFSGGGGQLQTSYSGGGGGSYSSGAAVGGSYSGGGGSFPASRLSSGSGAAPRLSGAGGPMSPLGAGAPPAAAGSFSSWQHAAGANGAQHFRKD